MSDANELRGNIFDLKKLHNLKMIMSLSCITQDNEYWVVQNNNGLVYTNWKTKIKVKHIIGTSAEKEHIIVGECSIMDDNFVYTHVYDMYNYTFFQV